MTTHGGKRPGRKPSGLGPEYQEVLRLYEHEGLAPAAIAEQLAECVERQWLNDYAPTGISGTVTIRRDGLDRGTITIRDGEIARWRAV